MEDSDLVRYYKEKAKEWIFQRTDHNYIIEDDEILDLDSISLGSDEDTWLYSSDEKSFGNSSADVSFVGKESTSSSMYSNFNENLLNFKLDASYNSSPLSPLIDVNNCSDSLIHLPDVSTNTVANFLTVTPFEEKKPKSYLKTALCNQFRANRVNTEEKGLESSSNKSKTEFNTFQKYEDVDKSLIDGAVGSKRNRPNNECTDKSFVLHSVENKLFTITDADPTDTFSKSSQNRDAHNQKLNEEDSVFSEPNELPKTSLPSKTTELSIAKEYEKKPWSSKTVRLVTTKNTNVNIGENDENDHRSAVKRTIPFCQSTPMLLNRYLKYNKSIDDSKNFSNWRTSAEFLKEDDIDEFEDDYKHELNVSYIKEATPPGEEIPTEHDSIHLKSTTVLNSTYNMPDDDQTSSASESSVSSFSNKPSYSIRDVQKMAELQERDLKQQVQSKYFPESSKSSEISSSNESISAFSPVSSSNEGHIDNKINVSNSDVQRLSYKSRRPVTAENVISSNSQNRTLYGNDKKTPDQISKRISCSANETFRSKLQPPNGSISPRNRQSNKNEQNIKNVSIMTKISANETTTHFPFKTKEVKSSESFPDAMNSTFTSRLSMMKTTRNESPSKERKTSDDLSKTMIHPRRSASPGPVSHIPRPSSRIPMLRASSSCTRYSKNAYSSTKK